MLPTETIEGVEIFREGTYSGDRYDTAALQTMANAFNAGLGFKPTVTATTGSKADGEARKVFGAPALGYVERLYVRGGKLLADLCNVPRKLAAKLRAGQFKRISPSVYIDYDTGAGRRWSRVLKSIAFVGADVPPITSLGAVEGLYEKISHGPIQAYSNSGHEIHVYNFEKQSEKKGSVMENLETFKEAYRAYSEHNDTRAGIVVNDFVDAYRKESGIDNKSKALRDLIKRADFFNQQGAGRLPLIPNGPTATQLLGKILAGVLTDLDGTYNADDLIRALEGRDEILIDAAGERFEVLAGEFVDQHGMPGLRSPNLQQARITVRRLHPELRALEAGEALSAEDLKTALGEILFGHEQNIG